MRRIDFGDRKTWMVITALFAATILIALIAYTAPRGRVADQPVIHIY
ncbi:hypothetical protein [Capsulimonas corticalis]|nr:hypothetical protein [Capsulimonas corticalis]